MKVAFVVESFPVVSETFIIDQVADLIDRGVDVEVFSFKKGDRTGISDRFYTYDLDQRTVYIGPSSNTGARVVGAWSRALRMSLADVRTLLRSLNFFRYGRHAMTLNLLYWVSAFAGKKFDVVHCHFGTVANKYLLIRDVLGIKQKFVTTFYGYDASRTIIEHGPSVYKKLRHECSLFFAMSQNMKDRLVSHGFRADQVIVHPVGIHVAGYPFMQRTAREGEPISILSVARLVEKKGIDDLLQALAIVRRRTVKAFRCIIIGDGPLKQRLLELTKSLGLQDIVSYKGYMKIEDIISLMGHMHFFVQPSKTAGDGNME